MPSKLEARVQAWRRHPGRPFVLGHRGARRRAPENTMAAFQLALEEGADGVELDVRLDGEGDVVVIHDVDLARVTSHRDVRRIADLGRFDLARVDLGGGERVPRLADVLAWAREHDARVNIELKRDTVRPPLLAWEVSRLVRAEREARDRFILSSFDPRLVALSARLLPEIPVGWLVESPRRVPGRSLAERLVGASALHPQTTLVARPTIAAWQAEGLPVNVWTVNDPDDARRLDALGVDTLISDEPGKILEALKR
jgi:glycerophosphoryl diester phosphodiesterase